MLTRRGLFKAAIAAGVTAVSAPALGAIGAPAQGVKLLPYIWTPYIPLMISEGFSGRTYFVHDGEEYPVEAMDELILRPQYERMEREVAELERRRKGKVQVAVDAHLDARVHVHRPIDFVEFKFEVKDGNK